MDQFKTDFSTNFGVSKNDIVSKTTFKLGHQKDGLIFGKNFHYIMDFTLLFPLTRIMTTALLTIMNFPRFKVKKIITQTAIEINTF